MMDKFKKDKEEINSYIYTDLTDRTPKRYEMVRYSTWRIYAYNELQSHISDFKKIQNNYWSQQLFHKIGKSAQQKGFYDVLYRPPLDTSKKEYERYDNISHFICRMLYCREDNTKYKFISMEKRILENRLKTQLSMKQSNTQVHRSKMMVLFKRILAHLKSKNSNQYNVPIEQWNQYSDKISFYTKSYMSNYEPTFQQYAKMFLEQGDIGLRKRRSFLQQGFVYINCQTMVDIIVANYEHYLSEKLSKTQPIVNQLIAEDTDNQFSVFLSKTIKQIYQQTMDEEKMQENYKLTLRNIDYLSQRFFPPCMLNLNQNLKKSRHLKHDGRRQLWGFFKACGMDVHDNKEYFRRHFQGKVTASQMRGHMYNIEHAYGLKGQRKDQRAWTCRGIIQNPGPKKGEHHGCPFAHWRSEQLKDFIRRNYKVTQEKLDNIISFKQQKHFQIACGRLFQFAEINQHDHAVPAQITAKLGRAPHMFFEAGMDLRSLKEKKGKGKKGQQKQESKAIDIEF